MGGTTKQRARASRSRVAPFRLSRRWIAVAALALVALLYVQPLRSYLDTRRQVTVRAVEVQTLAVRKRALERALRAQSSDAALLRAARQLGYVRPGERLYVVKGIGAWRKAQGAARAARGSDPG